MRTGSPTVLQGNAQEATGLFWSGEKWRSLGIRGVICAADNVRVQYPVGVASLVLPVDDDTDVPEAWYDIAMEFHRRFSPTFVHCNAGHNRSVIFGAALLCGDGMNLDAAIRTLYTVPLSGPILSSLRRWAAGRRAIFTPRPTA